MTLPFPSAAFRRPREHTSRMLFDFGVEDFSLTTPTGHTVTVDRNSEATALDSVGRVITLVQDQPAWSASYNSEDAQWEHGLFVGASCVNLCKYSEDFSGADWTATNSPTRTAAAYRIGDVVLDLIGDASGASQAMYSQTIALTGNTKKGVSIFVRRGSAPATSGASIKLRDTTAGVNRLAATITFTGTSLTPSVVASQGSVLESLALADGGYLLRLQASAVTAANTHSLQIIPADTSSEQGDIYAGGVLVSDDVYPERYRKTTTASVTTQPDNVSVTFAAVPQDMTLYMRLSKPLWAYDLTAAPAAGLCILGPQTTQPGFELQYNAGGSTVGAVLRCAGIAVTVASVTLPSTSQWEIAVQFRNLGIDPSVRINAGAGWSAWATNSLTPFTAWGNTTLGLGTETSPNVGSLDAVIRRFLIAPGHREMSELRGIPV